MTSSLALQLSQIAAKSTSQLNLKVQRTSHSQSLIFDKRVAGSQDFETIYQICLQGFRELCSLDARFMEFERTIFSEQSKAEDRTEMNATQNKELDTVLEAFLALVGGRLLLAPALKAVEWLVRRFRVHEYNMSFTLLTFLPYHTTPMFLNLLSILPEDLTPAFKILNPYKRSLINPPRHPLVHSVATNSQFFAALNSYVLQASRQHAYHHALSTFWAGMMVEAVSRMLESARSGRREVEKGNHEDIVLRVLSILNDGLATKGASELIIGCYMIAVVLAQKADLSTSVLDSLMEAVVKSWTDETVSSGLACVAILAQRKPDTTIPRRVFKAIVRLKDPLRKLSETAGQHPVSHLLLGLVAGCVRDFQKGDADLGLLLHIFESKHLGESEMSRGMATIIHAADAAHKHDGSSTDAQAPLAEMVQHFSRTGHLQPIFQKTLIESSIDIAILERNLQVVIEHGPTSGVTEDINMEDPEPEENQNAFPLALESLSKEDLYPFSFFAMQEIPMFDSLVHAFTLAIRSKDRLESFISLRTLGRDSMKETPQFLSFFIRVATGPYPTRTRAAALSTVSSALSLLLPEPHLDLQVLLPFLLVTLSDPSEKIRRESSNIIAILGRLYKKGKRDDNQLGKPWAHDTCYGETESSKVIWLSGRDAYKIFSQALLPGLEEYILDSEHAGKAMGITLQGSTAAKDSGSSELKKSLRLSLFSCLCSHAAHMPLLMPKLGLLKLLSRIDKTGGLTRTKELQPLLESWCKLRRKDVEEACAIERISVVEMERQIAAIVTPKDKDAAAILLSSASSGVGSSRPQFVAAIFDRMKDIWGRISEDRQAAASEKLFDIAFGMLQDNLHLSKHCRDVLRNVSLPGAALVHFLRKIPASVADMEAGGLAPKRRRISQNNTVAITVTDEAELNKLMEKITFILELVDSSAPETRPELADGLFQTLAALHHFKLQIYSSMSYLLSLALGSLLAIVNQSRVGAAQSVQVDVPMQNQENMKPMFDTSIIRADLVVDCVRSAESPQVQNVALLLVAGLSAIAPELVLHSVMPIFTFMGSNILKKDDDYSVSVIDQTIDQVVPALIQSLRKQKRDIISGTSELLISFTAAFEHIPSHRRLRLFHALITKLGTQDFLFAVLSMLANRYALKRDVLTLMTSLASDTSAQVELATYSKYLTLVSDSLHLKPGISQVLLGVGGDGGREPQKTVLNLLRALAYVMKHSSLKAKIADAFASRSEDISGEIRTLFSQILEQILATGDAVESFKHISQANSDVLGALFDTLSLIDFLDTLEVLLQRRSDGLRRKALRLLEGRLHQHPQGDSPSQVRMLDFLPTLISIIQSSPDNQLKHIAVACIDRIAEKYGRKNPSKVIPAAKVIASETCIGQGDNQTCIIGVLCLASMTEVLGQAMIPALPEIFSQSLKLLEKSLERGGEDYRLHDAVLSLLSALFTHLPFMVTSTHLDKILILSFKSAAVNMGNESGDCRQEALRLMARKIDLGSTLSAVDRNWERIIEAGPETMREILETVGVAIEKHPKSAATKNLTVLSSVLFKAFDLRREQAVLSQQATFEAADIGKMEDMVNEAAIKMIYKLNDTTFRPIFVKFVEWATGGTVKDIKGRLPRLTTFYKFLQVFFGTLQSIVTSYASYIVESAASVLETASPSDKDTKILWLAAMRMLRSAFEHDQDELWQSPTRLATISAPLMSQLGHATSSSLAETVISEVIPTITELAAASDSTDSHKELNSALMKFLRPSAGFDGTSASGENPYTRFVALKAEQALTERLGEEWLALLPEMLPCISELMEDDDESVEREARKWIKQIEEVLGERLDDMLT